MDPGHVLNIFTFIAMRAREIAAEVRGDGLHIPVEMKGSDRTPLTVADTRINEMAIAVLAQEFPGVRLVGEEGDGEGEGHVVALLDPLDGTITFEIGLLLSTICLSFMDTRQGVTTHAMIADLFERRRWTRIGADASTMVRTYQQYAAAQVSSHTSIEDAKICMIWWRPDICPFDLNPVCAELMDRGAKVLQTSSVAALMGLLASGMMDAVIFPGPYAYETVAGAHLVTGARGRATTLFGHPIMVTDDRYIRDGSILSNGHLHNELVEICQRFVIRQNNS